MQKIITGILEGEIEYQKVNDIVQTKFNLESILDCSTLITDCYFALRHIEEEKIDPREWVYFLECFTGKREYNMDEKMSILLSKSSD